MIHMGSLTTKTSTSNTSQHETSWRKEVQPQPRTRPKTYEKKNKRATPASDLLRSQKSALRPPKRTLH